MIQKHKISFFILVVLSLLSLLVAACAEAAPACPPVTGTPAFLTVPPDKLPTPTPSAGGFEVEIGSSAMQVDKVVSGPLCNDDWRGTVYVSCDVKVYPWLEEPTFLKNCQLTIEPQTVVYVAYHNNTAYYTGCSCHIGVTPAP